jgi:hypothetical protein
MIAKVVGENRLFNHRPCSEFAMGLRPTHGDESASPRLIDFQTGCHATFEGVIGRSTDACMRRMVRFSRLQIPRGEGRASEAVFVAGVGICIRGSERDAVNKIIAATGRSSICPLPDLNRLKPTSPAPPKDDRSRLLRLISVDRIKIITPLCSHRRPKESDDGCGIQADRQTEVRLCGSPSPPTCASDSDVLFPP